jgi:tRNA pseudouridine55 synthase
VNGLLIVDKPAGPTSHDIVAQARRRLQTRGVGHAGTLDPMATGLLVLLIGEATKLQNFLSGQDKRYRARVAFGRATDTHDALGTLTEERSVVVDRAALEQALAEEQERREQVPPEFSAVHVGGERAHRVARRGESVTLGPREVRVHEARLLDADAVSATVELSVTKGYYVRAFARDLGRRLGVPAHLAALRRTASGPFAIEEAIRWPPAADVVPMPLGAAARRALAVVTLTTDGELRARQGKPLASDDFEQRPEARVVAWLSASGELVAVGEEREPGVFRVIRGFSAH